MRWCCCSRTKAASRTPIGSNTKKQKTRTGRVLCFLFGIFIVVEFVQGTLATRRASLSPDRT